MQPHPQQMGQYGQHMRPAEVEGGNRSKAQLIVGIDFVSTDAGIALCEKLTGLGYHLLRCGICVCDEYRSERGHNNRMAWRR